MDKSVIYCNNCGLANTPDALFCQSCGRPILINESSYTPPAQVVHPPVQTDEPAVQAAQPAAQAVQPAQEEQPVQTEPAAAPLKPALSPVECPYCGSIMRVSSDVDQLICIECGAALKVSRSAEGERLDILTF